MTAIRGSSGGGAANATTAVDDGTYITVSFSGTKLFRIRKSDGQMQILGGYDSDITL